MIKLQNKLIVVQPFCQMSMYWVAFCFATEILKAASLCINDIGTIHLTMSIPVAGSSPYVTKILWFASKSFGYYVDSCTFTFKYLLAIIMMSYAAKLSSGQTFAG